MTHEDLTSSVKTAVDEWMQSNSRDQQLSDFEQPALLSFRLSAQVEQELIKSGHSTGVIRQTVMAAPYLHLKQAFKPADLPLTPDSFIPVPDVTGSLAGRAAALAVHGFLRMETVSYGTENDGALFVNLVPLSGEGVYADKSKKGMRGHTDAVSFPFNGDIDSTDPRLAPSPDLVTLVGLRNPSSVATKVMVLELALAQLSATDIDQLKKHQYSMIAQATFKQGMKNLLGDVHTAIDEPVLKDAPTGTQVRYSHSSVLSTEIDGIAKTACDNFEAACRDTSLSVRIQPGDVLILSNRLCLHGRAEVGDSIGGESRWLLRTYGLDTSNLEAHRRHMKGRPPHVLYP